MHPNWIYKPYWRGSPIIRTLRAWHIVKRKSISQPFGNCTCFNKQYLNSWFLNHAKLSFYETRWTMWQLNWEQNIEEVRICNSKITNLPYLKNEAKRNWWNINFFCSNGPCPPTMKKNMSTCFISVATILHVGSTWQFIANSNSSPLEWDPNLAKICLLPHR